MRNAIVIVHLDLDAYHYSIRFVNFPLFLKVIALSSLIRGIFYALACHCNSKDHLEGNIYSL